MVGIVAPADRGLLITVGEKSVDLPDGVTRESGEPGAGNPHAGFCGGRWSKCAAAN